MSFRTITSVFLRVLCGFLFFIFLNSFSILQAQEAEEPDFNYSLSPERQRIEMEIRTSTLSELALWSRTLGLSESGSREDLSRRLQNYFDLPQTSQNNDNQKVIIIESAQVSEYFTIDVIDEEYARLRGDVFISLKDGNTIHKIRANEVLFNRTRNILTASGQVFYEKDDGDRIETFRGENITVNLDNWASIFLDGSSTRSIENDETTYLFSGSVITRTDQDVTILRDAEITNGSNEEALWSISASRIWLLPGSDFAILNAVLRVGVIPVLYIPFFYFPGDELFFHPVIGYRSREGGFVQTTTYIFGQPRSNPDESNSISRLLANSNDTEKELQGLFLRSTGRKIVDPNELSLKAFIDYYVNLGMYIGLDLTVPKTGIFNPVEFSLGVGFTRTISLINGVYTPYAPDYDGSYDWNHSNLFSFSAPFRYRMTFNSSISGTRGNISWSFPFYSDPFVDRDFLNRAESMDWINMIQQGSALGDDPLTQNEIRTHQWHVNGNLNIPTSSVSPFISRIAITNISTTLTFRTIEDFTIRNDSFYNNNPARFFFAPDKFTIYNLSSVISGTPYSFGGQQSLTRPNDISTRERINPLEGIGNPISPWTADEENTENNTASKDILTPPVLTQTFRIPGTGNTRLSIDYQISPASSTELQFMTANWKTLDQVSWDETQSILTSISGNSALNFRADHSSGLFSNVFTLSGNGTWRDYGYLNEDAFLDGSGNVDENRMMEARRQQYSQTNYSTFYAYNSSIRPLHDNLIFSQSSIQYSLRGTLVRSKRYSGGDSPELTPQWGSWAKEERINGIDIYGLNNHRLTGSLAANIRDKVQSISISADLPPLDGMIETRIALRFWISETNLNFRTERPPESDWIFKPINFTQALKFNDKCIFTYNMIIKPEEDNDITHISTSLVLWNFRTAFTADKSYRYRFETLPVFGGEWVEYGNQILNPKELLFSYNQTTPSTELINNRLFVSFNTNASLNFNLRQHTNSNFQLSFGLNLNIPGFLELKFSATTQNSVIMRYFKGMPGMDNLTFMYPEGPQNNIFTDLFDSFNFFDDDKRRRSGFKMQKFDFKLTHFLGDWRAELDISMYPHRNTISPVHMFSIVADVSFTVRWTPITEIYSDIAYDGKNNRWVTR
ncbi:MAG: LPS-assembly protein LptD [Treponema sp.]|nr:LPS-assembly protein LptD [Treponema sp.]